MITLKAVGMALAIDLLVAAAGQYAYAATPQKVAAKTQIEGQVFIVTKGQQAVKLALVNVIAAPADDINKFIAGRVVTANSIRKGLIPTLLELRNSCAAIHQELAPLRAKSTELWDESKREDQRCGSIVGGMLDCLNRSENYGKRRVAVDFYEQIKPLLQKERDITAALKEVTDRFNFSGAPSVFLTGVEASVTPLASAKTDADGKFTLEVPTGKRIALIASTKRLAAGETEEYRWIVWVEPQIGTSRAIATLANDNLIETGCAECVTYSHLLEQAPTD